MRRPTADQPIYHEHARGYATSWTLLALMVGGFALDAALGGARSHAIAWVLAAAVVVGVDVFGVHASRMLRSITVTDDALLVGNDERIARSNVVAANLQVDPLAPVLGRTPGAGLPRFVPGLQLRMVDGRGVVVPTKHPERLAAALELSLSREIVVRPVRADELALLPVIEDRSGSLFTVAGLDLPPGVLTIDELRGAAAVFVAGDPPVGFAMVDVLDGQPYLHQLSVLPSHMRRGIGATLIEATCDWARERGYRAITLTTFTDVPWNGPYYRARGFVELPDPPAQLAAVRAAEVASGLDDVQPRCTMIRAL